MAQYAIETTDNISEPIKIAVVIQHIKGPLVQHLKLNISADSKWSTVHDIIVNYYSSVYSGE
eukprot:2748673-Amphidinium_carterae.1